jgi:hypothetical protein
MEDRGLGRDHPGEEQAVEIERGGMVERADLIEGANLIQPFPLFQRIGIQRSGIGQKPPDRGPLAVEGGHDGSHGRDTGAGNGKRSKNGEHGRSLSGQGGGPPSEGYRVALA